MFNEEGPTCNEKSTRKSNWLLDQEGQFISREGKNILGKLEKACSNSMESDQLKENGGISNKNT